jgi:hypothetical protein
VTLMPVVYDGSNFTQRPFTTGATPYEGDAVLAPAGGMVVTRVNAAGDQAGYPMRQVNATWNGTSYDVDLPVVATYCVKGAKPALSFDERWMVVHHYITDDDATDLGFSGPSDPGWAPYHNQGSADIYLVDMLTGTETRLTRMGPGQFALYPHFRSDGWIYFITKGSEGEHVIASDAALFLAGG